MAKCSKCKKRKAKRYCVALGQELCSLCCGLLREKEINCPSTCSFLEKHKFYQEKRIIEKKHPTLLKKLSPDEDILRDERMAWLALHIEAPLKEYVEKQPSFTDKEALLALEYAKEKIERDKGYLFIPEDKIRIKNEMGEAIYQNIENCRYEGKIIIPGKTGTYNKEEKIKCLERIILSVKYWAKNNFEARNYTEQLVARFSKLKDQQLIHHSKPKI